MGEISYKETLMPRRLFFILLFLALMLAACKPASQTGTVTGEASATPKATAGSTTAPKPAATLAMPGAAPSVPGCTVVSFMPTPDPTSLFPTITEDDHYRGSLSATVKIIEYSDFQ
jgi:hypothetical protein